MNKPTTGAELLLLQIENEMAPTETALLAGQASDLAEYKRMCGYLQGLERASQLVKDLAKQMENDDDE